MIVEKKNPEAGGPDVTVLYIEGLIKLGESAEFFSSALSNVLKNEKGAVIVDFTKVDYIDSTGVGELVGYIAHFAGKGNIVLSGTSERLKKLLKLVKMDQAFPMFENEDEAFAHFATAASR